MKIGSIVISITLLLAGLASGDDGLVKKTKLNPSGAKSEGGPLFVALKPEQSGIAPTHDKNGKHPLTFFYGSGMETSGVAVGDVNGDGKPDVFLASSPGENRLYLQTEDLKFQEATKGSGLDADFSWSRGASILDIDNDGDRDIFVANYGEPNRLYINEGAKDGVPVHFVEKGRPAGLARADASLSPAFCDYDRDGDLDMYLVAGEYTWPNKGVPPDPKKMIGERNGKPVINPPFDQFFKMKEYHRSPDGIGWQVKWDRTGRPDIMYRNNGDGTFSDVTREIGMIYDNGRGLSATWWDYNDDGYPDLYVANDWADRDFLYENQGDGTFKDVIAEAIPSSPMFSMGADTGDLNGDGRLDLMVADMSGTTHYKRKISMGSMQADTIDFMVNARPPQAMRNFVFLNTGTSRVQESAYMMGLANTDWSWSVKIADLDNDGHSDVFVTNGMEQNIRQFEEGAISDADLSNEKNLALRNDGDYHFTNMGEKWGLDHYGFSLAAVTCDFDRDGDLDVFVNHRDEMPVLYKNTSESPGLLIRLHGKKSNEDGVGATLRLETKNGVQVRQVNLMRGYLSCDEAVTHFGLGELKIAHKLIIHWPSGSKQVVTGIEAGFLYDITEAEVGTLPAAEKVTPMFNEITSLAGIVHTEKPFDDFAVQPLLPNKLSQLGPGIAVGDLDSDGDDDFLVGGALGDATKVVLNTGQGNFAAPSPIAGSELFEDMGMVLFDVDSDGDEDLYVVSGGVETSGAALSDRLYLNDGKGVFTAAPDDAYPRDSISGGPVAAADIDHDGDLDLFVGGRVVPGSYPAAAPSRLLVNEGGKLKDKTEALAPFLESFGLVTGGVFSDIDNDGWQDLLIAREWGTVAWLKNEKGTFKDVSEPSGLSALSGWWNGVATCDIDGDGDMDIVATNFGLNTKYHASKEHPALIYYGKFGTDAMQIIEAEFEDETLFPVRGKSCSTRAIPHLAEKFKTFHSFAQAELQEIYSEPVIKDSTRYAADTLLSGVYINDGQGRFEFKALPKLAQIAPGFGILSNDFNGDTLPDIFVAQNFYNPQPETGRMSGGLGVLFAGDGKGGFSSIPNQTSGLVIPEDAKAACVFDSNGDAWPDLLVSTNNGPLRGFTHSAVAEKDTGMLKVILKGRKGNKRAIGSRVRVVKGERTQIVDVQAGGGFLGQSSGKLFFGTGGESAVHVEVTWPDGKKSEHPVEKGRSVLAVEHP